MTEYGTIQFAPQPAASELAAPRFALGRLLRFGGISGAGWLLDFGVLYGLVHWGRLAPFSGNLISATVSAMAVFLISSRMVFAGRSDSMLMRSLAYCVYTVANIVLFSFAIAFLAGLIASAGSHVAQPFTTAQCAMFAKLCVTPFSFLANFAVARFMSQYATTLA